MEQSKQTTLLVVDDDERNRKLLGALLVAEGYAARFSASGEEALASVAERLPDLILLDVMMPGLDGFEVARRLKADAKSSAIPIVMVTALADRDSRLKGLEAGVEEFLTKPVDRAELRARVKNLLRIKEYNDFLADHNRLLEEQVRARTLQLTESYRDTIFALARAAEFHDEDTGLHVKRVSHYSAMLAERLGMDAGFRDAIFYASPMHDLGKIGIPDAVMLKPSGLDDEEWRVMKRHPELGAQILGTISESPYMLMGIDIALGHHERWDGSGYPSGRCGGEIPLAARIMALGDVYDALRAKRPYKPPFTHERAVETITQGDGRTVPAHFDPAVLAAFRDCAGGFREIFSTHAD
ncbi:MAG: two-component system response regulator [Gammaproteobacteria bacterium RIFOXYA12_FULL_61_12]|nr:MAG: two-component system response regulator [Gammaproteobacteria bacterium RIFOXYD12_FULL_61_37]OGT88776.1 MAG: two-component system response regulator [Gammaproteobacteria bacterium RIFOXYA12_FULL_61_12]